MHTSDNNATESKADERLGVAMDPAATTQAANAEPAQQANLLMAENEGQEGTVAQEGSVAQETNEGQEESVAQETNEGQEESVAQEANEGQEESVAQEANDGQEESVAQEANDGQEGSVVQEPNEGQEGSVAQEPNEGQVLYKTARRLYIEQKGPYVKADRDFGNEIVEYETSLWETTHTQPVEEGCVTIGKTQEENDTMLDSIMLPLQGMAQWCTKIAAGTGKAVTSGVFKSSP